MLETGRTNAVLFGTFDEGRNWSKLSTNPGFQELFFLDSQHGWTTMLQGDYNSILATSDGGLNWETICPRVSAGALMVTQIFFADVSHGWLFATKAGGLHAILETTDGGRTFASSGLSAGKFSAGDFIFSSPDSDKLWVLGNDLILRSSDHGQSWVPQVSSGNLPGKRKAIAFKSGQAFDNGTVIVAGSSGGAIIFKSNDFGQNWKLVGQSDEAHWFDALQFWNDKHGCAVGGSTLLFCTSDGGDTWEARNVLPKAPPSQMALDNIFQKVFFASDGMRGWVLAAGGFVFQTVDGGNSWRRIDPVDSPAFR